jgi:AI-2 transport protein TqsA
MTQIASLFIVLSISVLTLVLGKNLIIPFVFALLIWLLMRKIRELFDWIPLFKKWIPNWVKTILSTLLLLFIFIVLGKLVEANVSQLIASFGKYENHVGTLLSQLEKILPINFDDLSKEIQLNETIGKYLTSIFNSLRSVVENALIILLYVLFILLEESSFKLKVKALFPVNAQHERSLSIFNKIEASITNYIGLKTLIAISAATISYVILRIIGIEAPLFWALLIFIFNFIPTIGALVGTLFPTLFAFIQFGYFTPGLMILLFVGTAQLLVGNLLEPKLMGNSLNISPLVAIFALSFWGAIWGITGMFLSVPITVIMVIVFSHFSKTRAIAILLSEKGVIDSNQ